MTEPWNLKTDVVRTVDSLPTFIIFCEDENSEPIYFKYFETNLIKVNVIQDQKSKLDSIVNAVCHCQDNGLLDSEKPDSTIENLETFVWCVYDRDKETNPNLIQKGNISFDEAIAVAETKGIKTAWSNDSFELWVLLHFKEVDLDDSYCNRNLYYQELTSVFNNLPTPNEDLIKAKQYENFSYKNSLKSKNNFRYIVRPEMLKNTELAIERSERLEIHFSTKEINPHLKCPCTLVHLLVKDLIKFGKKDININV